MWRIIERVPAGFSHNVINTAVVAVHNPAPLAPGGSVVEPTEEQVRKVAEQWNSEEDYPVVMTLPKSKMMKYEPVWYLGHGA